MPLTLPVATHERLEHFHRGVRRNVVESLREGSPAAAAGVAVGDQILTANGALLHDIVDWKYHTAGEQVELGLLRDGETVQVLFRKGYDEDPGIVFNDDLFDRLHLCKNKCVFCFLYQQPKGLRPSLYVKDDDFRLSFLHGNYVTLTNLKDGELDRICEQRLSPLFVSIHATDPEARGRILGRPGEEPILPLLDRLADSRIQIHGQIVLCPGYNDGEILERTIRDLAERHPSVRGTYGGIVSVAVVPIGITQFRERLAPVEIVCPDQARAVLDWCEARRREYLPTLGTRFVYPSDEFYLNTGVAVPPRSHYEGFPQLEDGVGLVRLFLDDLEKVRRRLPKASATPGSFTFVTGEIAAPLVEQLAAALSRVDGIRVNVLAVHNHFFEGNINIAGLVVGCDIVAAARDFPMHDTVVIPSVMLRDGEAVFLDEMTVDALSDALGRPVLVVERTPSAAAEAVLDPSRHRAHLRDGNV
ncbi:MAG: DUF512 domain-containing protein [Armatimonadota bacterium]